jgi:hypothetical protein
MTPPNDSSPKRRLSDRLNAWVKKTFSGRPLRQGIAIFVALLVLSVAAIAVTRGPEADTVAPSDIGLAEEENEEEAEPSPSPSEEPSPTSSEAPEESNTEPSPEATLECRNSTNPDCGPFYWDPPPGENKPLTVDVQVNPQRPQAGEKVIFTIFVRDRDAKIDRQCISHRDFGDGSPPEGCEMTGFCPTMYGPWDTPPKGPDEWEFTLDHVYEEAGEYTATFRFISAGGPDPGCPHPHPYASSGEGSVTFVVEESGLG